MRKDRFTDEALRNAQALAELEFSESLDFARCQRADGSFYGIPEGKQCKKGAKAAPAEPKPRKLKTDFRKEVEAGAEMRRKRDAAIEKLQQRQMRLRKAYAKANQDAAAAIKARDPKREEKAKARVAKLGEALDSANEMMRKYTGNRGNTGGRIPSKAETEAKTPKRRDSEDVRRKGGKLIGTSPRNMAIDRLKELKQEAADYKRKFSSRSGEESIKKIFKVYEDRIAAAEKSIKEKYGDS